jgi:methanogenic corrinoid protein MtbC1
MGARVGADFLEMQGFGVMFLGADVPTDSLVSMIAKEKPDLVALSVTMSFHLDSLRRTVDRVRAALPQVPITVGGHALSWAPEIAAELPDEVAIGEDAPQLVKRARELLKMDVA